MNQGKRIPVALLALSISLYGFVVIPTASASSQTSCQVESGVATECEFTCFPGDFITVFATQPNAAQLKIRAICGGAVAMCEGTSTTGCGDVSANPAVYPDHVALVAKCDFIYFSYDAVGTCSASPILPTSCNDFITIDMSSWGLGTYYISTWGQIYVETNGWSNLQCDDFRLL